VALMLPAPTLARAMIAKIIGDEAALKAAWVAKGAAGIRPCFFCANVVSKHSGLAGAGGSTLVDIGCADPTRFQRVSDEDTWAAVDNLRAQKNNMTQKDFAILERASGRRRRMRRVMLEASATREQGLMGGARECPATHRRAAAHATAGPH